MDLAPSASIALATERCRGSRDLHLRLHLPRRGRVTMMIDIQAQPDLRRVAIDQVGVSDLRYPIVVLDRRTEKQHTIASLSMSVGLPHDQKGTHMSRFIEVLDKHRGELTVRTLPALL